MKFALMIFCALALSASCAMADETIDQPTLNGLPIATFGGQGVSTWNEWCHEAGFSGSIAGSAVMGAPAAHCCGNAAGAAAFTAWNCNLDCNYATLAQITCAN